MHMRLHEDLKSELFGFEEILHDSNRMFITIGYALINMGTLFVCLV